MAPKTRTYENPQDVIRNLEDFAGIASDWFWETDKEHRFTYFSSRMQEVTGIKPEAILGQRRDQLKAIGLCKISLEQHILDLRNRSSFRNFEYQIKRHTNTGSMWLRVSGDPVFDENGAFVGYRGTGHDITAEKVTIAQLAAGNEALEARNRELDRLRRELELAAFEDPLTGLRNRRAFDTAIEEALAPAMARVGLLHMDVDHFKQVNDTLGHPAGDMVLVTLASRINALCVSGCEVFRIGGDEFTLILNNCASLDHGIKLGASIIKALQEPIAYEGKVILIGASIGVALSAAIPTSPHRLIAQADTALYEAKAAGRNCVRSATSTPQ